MGDGVTVGVGDGVMLGDGVILGVAVDPSSSAFCGMLQAVKSAISQNPSRVFFPVMLLLILANEGAVNLIAFPFSKGRKLSPML